MRKLKWAKHSDLAIRKTPTIRREEYLDYMTFQSNERPLFTEIFGPLIGLKEELTKNQEEQEKILDLLKKYEKLIK